MCVFLSAHTVPVAGYTGDVYMLVKLLLPTAGKKRVYNLQSKQIVKLLSQVRHKCLINKLVASSGVLITTVTLSLIQCRAL